MEESTHEVARHGRAVERTAGSPGFLMKFDSITYDYAEVSELLGGPLYDKDLGSRFAVVNLGANAEVTTQSTNPTTEDGGADKVPVYAVEGYDTSFRLAVRVGHSIYMFEALSNPEANDASDVLDLGGKVSRIDVTKACCAGIVRGTIKDPKEVGQLVQGLMDAPLKATGPDYYGAKNHFMIVFYLKDGTAVARDYRTDTGRLTKVFSRGVETPASGVVAPKAFRAAVEQALKGYLEKQEAKLEGEQRQKLTCGDTRTTNELRRIDLYGTFYTTNDVPGGPWGGAFSGTEKDDKLAGEDGEDEVYGLGGDDVVLSGFCDDRVHGGPGDDRIFGGDGSDVIQGGPGGDHVIGDLAHGGGGTGGWAPDALYGGDGNDGFYALDGRQDELFCGGGRDEYIVDEIDHVASSCEVRAEPGGTID